MFAKVSHGDSGRLERFTRVTELTTSVLCDEDAKRELTITFRGSYE